MILVGPSGCGKSTALRMIAGLEDISEGELFIGDEVVNDLAPKDRDIAMVFQNYALYPHMTVRENMGFALKLAKVDSGEINTKVEEAARILDLQDHLDRKPANLSGGQRQRVAMGRAIVRDPKVFLMDEPLSNLDAKLRVQMRTEVSRIQKRLGTTMVYVTHDQTEAMTLGDRVAVMRAGVIQQVDAPKVLYEDPVNLFVAGSRGSPAMNFLPARLEGDQLELPFGTTQLPGNLASRIQSDGQARDVIAGLRPEHFEDAALTDERHHGGMKFKVDIDVVESMGSELYAYFDVEAKAAESEELAALAEDAGLGELPGAGASGGATHVVARLDSDSQADAGREVELVLDTAQIKLFDPNGGRSLTSRPDRQPAGAGAGAGTATTQGGGDVGSRAAGEPPSALSGVGRALCPPPARRRAAAAPAAPLGRAQALEHLIRPVVRAQQQVALRDDAHVGVRLGLAPLDQAGGGEHLDHGRVVLVEPQASDLRAIHERAVTLHGAEAPGLDPLGQRPVVPGNRRLDAAAALEVGRQRLAEQPLVGLDGQVRDAHVGAGADAGVHLGHVGVDVLPPERARDGDAVMAVAD